MPKRANKVKAFVIMPNEEALRNIKQSADSLFAYAVREYLEGCSLSANEKKKIIARLISELK